MAATQSGACDRLRSMLSGLCCESAVVTLSLLYVLTFFGEILIDCCTLTATMASSRDVESHQLWRPHKMQVTMLLATPTTIVMVGQRTTTVPGHTAVLRESSSEICDDDGVCVSDCLPGWHKHQVAGGASSYNIIQAHREAAELHVLHKPRNKKSLWEGKNGREERCLTRCSQRHQ